MPAAALRFKVTLGLPAGPVTVVTSPAGKSERFVHGSVYFSPKTCGHVVLGETDGHYRQLGGPAGVLGFPTGDTPVVALGYQRPIVTGFQNGAIDQWHQGTFAVVGAIYRKWSTAPFGSQLGNPTSDEESTPGVQGRWSMFQRGAIVAWTGGVYSVRGAIYSKWVALGAAGGMLGRPTTDQQALRSGQMSSFEQGAIVAWPQGVFELHGPVYNDWKSFDGANGPLGNPTTSIGAVQGGYGGSNAYRRPQGGTYSYKGQGVYANFQHGAVYWTSVTGAAEIHGAVFNRWAQSGAVNGPLGFPLDNQSFDSNAGAYVSFQNGFIADFSDTNPGAAPLIFCNELLPGCDKRSPQPPCTTSCPAPGSGGSGVSQLKMSNCHNDQLSVDIWTYDMTAQDGWQEQTEIPAMYDENGACPNAAAVSVFTPADGHTYIVKAVDPGNPSCGTDDPTVASCGRLTFAVTGDPKGQALTVTVR